MQGRDPPLLDFARVDIEGRLVELDHIDADFDQLLGLLIQQCGKSHGQSDLVAIMGIGDRIRDRHWSRQGEFEPTLCFGAGNCRLEGVDTAFPSQPAGDGRHFRIITIGADAHRDSPGKIDAINVFEKAVDEVLTRLLAVGDDVDPGVFLLLQHQQCCVAFCFDQCLAYQAPWRPQHLRLSQPTRLWQAAGDRRLEHLSPPAPPIQRGRSSKDPIFRQPGFFNNDHDRDNLWQKVFGSLYWRKVNAAAQLS